MTNFADLSSPQNLVTLIIDDIYLKNISTDKIDAIREIGAHEEKDSGKTVWAIGYRDEHDLAAKLADLNRLGFLFVGEPAGWPPAAVFDYLREKKLLKGSFKEITWRGPGDWFIIER